MSYYYLEVERGREVGRRYPVADGAVSIGRSSRNNIPLHSDERSVSGHHAIVYKSPGRIMVQDLQSTNGTFVNEQRVNEKELAPGDVVGFGASGPRLRLIESESELATEPRAPAAPAREPGTRSKTIDDDRSPRRKTYTAGRMTKSDEGLARARSEEYDLTYTSAMERKIVERRAGGDDIHALLKDGKRVARLVGRGNLGETQANLILSAFHANRKTRIHWQLILAVVAIVATGAIIFFAGRAMQYKRLLDRGLALEEKLDRYDRLIVEARADPNASREKLMNLIARFDETGAELASVRGSIRDVDFDKFYADTVEEYIAEILSRFGETSYHIPPQMVERVKFHLDVYSGRLKATIDRYLVRKEKYFPMIRTTLKQNNLPQELAYIAMLESGFNSMALSHAGARGMWQFMEATGRRYGLHIDAAVDERTEPEKATRAAAEYFKDLIGIFGGKSSLMLAMAAYNAGEGRVQRALRRIEDPIRNRDFWYIYRMGYLAEETNEYIPRVFAMMIMSEHQAQYGFSGAGVPDVAQEDLEAEHDFLEIDFTGPGDDPQP